MTTTMTPASPHLLQESVLREIAATAAVRRYPAHAVIIHEGDAADTLFIILSGRVKVYVSNEAGKEVVLNQHGPGEYVGEVALDGDVRSASVATLEPTTCAAVPGVDLCQFIADHPDFAMVLIRNLSHRLRDLTGNLKSLALEDVYSRVVGLLTRLSTVEGPHRVVAQRLTQQDIAERVGASREMVSRIFKDLTTGGYLRVESGRVTLLKKLPAAW